jgi:hypothetical protein
MSLAHPQAEIPPQPVPGTPAAPVAWWKSDAFFIAATLIVTLAIAWGMARHELVQRAKKAYFEGEKYYAWYQDPAKKKAYFDGELAAGRINPDQYSLLMDDNDLKNAYVWYETVIDLFQPPRSEWVLKSEDRMKEVKPKYQAWLRGLGIDPVE